MLMPVRLVRPRFRLGLVGLAALLLVGSLVLNLTLVSTTRAATSTGTWTTTGSMHVPRFSSTATLLPNGKVLSPGVTAAAPRNSTIPARAPGPRPAR